MDIRSTSKERNKIILEFLRDAEEYEWAIIEIKTTIKILCQRHDVLGSDEVTEAGEKTGVYIDFYRDFGDTKESIYAYCSECVKPAKEE